MYLVNPAYTSTIGNLKYDYYDPINASLEIGRRGYLYNKRGMNDQFYPTLILKSGEHQWKDVLQKDSLKSWVKVHDVIKNSKITYRVPLSETVFRRTRIKTLPIGIF
jgi:hypothetical protein